MAVAERSQRATGRCLACGESYDGYHRCAEGSDRVVFRCIDCREIIDRERHHMDVEGMAPRRCATCVLDAMARS